MTLSEEMKKLRKMLDEDGIKWIDRTCGQMTSTVFKIGRKNWSVICGIGSYGGYKGLLEVWDRTVKNDPVGYLTADEVMEIVKSRSNYDKYRKVEN